MARLASEPPQPGRAVHAAAPVAGRPAAIYGVEIGRDVPSRRTDEPTFVLLGLHHAREWPSGELAMEFAFDLVKRLRADARITDLVNRSRVVVVPVLNADGFDLSRTDGGVVDLREARQRRPADTSILGPRPGRRLQAQELPHRRRQDTPARHLRATATSPGGYGCGADLNRNYGGLWGGPGASTVFADPTYRGDAPFSEPETQNIQELISTRQMTKLITQPHVLEPGAAPAGRAPTLSARRLRSGRPRRGRTEGARRADGRRTTATQHPGLGELYDTTGATEDWTYNAPVASATRSRSAGRVPPAVPEGGRRVPRQGPVRRQGQPRGLPDRARERGRHPLQRDPQGQRPEGRDDPAGEELPDPTWESSFKDWVNTAIKAARGGIDWRVNPATRPVVRSHPYEDLSDKPFRKKVIEGGPIEPNSHVDHTFVLNGPADVFRTSLNWPTPDDLDLEVYRKTGDGKLHKVGSSGNFVGDKERVDINGAPAGTYVLRVINFASVTPTYTLTEALFNSVTRHTAGKRERYKLTCEKNGTVLQTGWVFIRRGESKWIDFSECRRKY